MAAKRQHPSLQKPLRARWIETFAPQLADKLMDAANLALGGLVLGQFLGGRDYDAALGGVGVLTWFVGYLAGAILLYFARRNEP